MSTSTLPYSFTSISRPDQVGYMPLSSFINNSTNEAAFIYGVPNEGAGIMFFDSNAQLVWNLTTTGLNNVFPSSVTINNTSVFVVGHGNQSPCSSSLIALDHSGNILWSYEFQPVGSYNLFGMGVAIDPNTNNIFTTTSSTSGTTIECFSNSGSHIWSNPIASDYMDIRQIAVSSDGGVIVGGYDNHQSAFGSNPGVDAFVAKYDSNGNELWIQGGPAIFEVNGGVITDIKTLANGDIVVCGCGQHIGGSPNTSGFVTEFSASGAVIFNTVLDYGNNSSWQAHRFMRVILGWCRRLYLNYDAKLPL